MTATQVRILQPNDEAELMVFLQPRLDASMFLVNNVQRGGLVDNGRLYQGSYAAAFEDGRIVAVAAHYWNGNLILQAPGHLAAVCAVAIRASKRRLQGVLGSVAQVKTAVTALSIPTTLIQLDESEKRYRLNLVDLQPPPPLQSGELVGRRASLKDLDIISAWRVAFAIELLGEPASHTLEQRCQRSASLMIKEKRVWLVEAAGQPVAMSGFNAAIAVAVQIGSVYTPPTQRSRGYGRAAVAASLLDVRQSGVQQALLFTGIDNIPAQKAYEALGFAQNGDYRVLLLRHGFEI